MDTLTVERRFCGPPASGNGGYVCGRLASFIDGCAKVRLMTPPPLDVPLQIMTTPDGVELRNKDQLVAKAWAQEFVLDVPASPSLAEAREMSLRYGGFEHHPFPTCFVCGPKRQSGDGLRIFPGPSSNGSFVGCPWMVDKSLCDDQGRLRTHFIWCALDCPSGWALLVRSRRPVVLGEFTVRVNSSVGCGNELVVIGWELERSGRKYHTASALFDATGSLLAYGQATWFEIEADSI